MLFYFLVKLFSKHESRLKYDCLLILLDLIPTLSKNEFSCQWRIFLPNIFFTDYYFYRRIFLPTFLYKREDLVFSNLKIPLVYLFNLDSIKTFKTLQNNE